MISPDTSIVMEYDATVESVVFSPDGTQLFVGPRYEAIDAFDLTGSFARTNFPNSRRNICLISHTDGALFYNDDDRRFSRRHPTLEQSRRQWFTSVVPFRYNLSPDSKWLAYNGLEDKSTVRLLDAASKDGIFFLPSAPADVTSITFSTDGRYVIGGLLTGALCIWRIADCTLMVDAQDADLVHCEEWPKILQAHDQRVTAVVCGADGHIYSACEGAWLFNRISRALPSHLKQHGHPRQLLAK